MSTWYFSGVPRNLQTGVLVNGRQATLTIRTIEDRTVKLFARDDIFGESETMRWMTFDDFNKAASLLDGRKYEEAKLQAVYGSAKGHALIDGFTQEEADIIAGWSFDAWKDVQLRSKTGYTLDTLRRDSLDIAVRNNVGQWMSGIGPLVTLIPVYGTIIGGVMILGGQALTFVQMNEVMKKASLSKKKELIAARTAFMKGEISKDEYIALQTAILQNVGEQMLADGEFGKITLTDDTLVMVQPSLIERIGSFVNEIVENPAMAALALAIGAAGAGAIWQVGTWVENRG